MSEPEQLSLSPTVAGVDGVAEESEEFIEPADGFIRQRVIDLLEQVVTGVSEDLILTDIDTIQKDISEAMRRGEFALPRAPLFSGMSQQERLAQYLALLAKTHVEPAVREALVTVADSQRADMATHIQSVIESPGYRLVSSEKANQLPKLQIDQARELTKRLFGAGRMTEADKALFDQIFDAKVAAVPAYVSDANTPAAGISLPAHESSVAELTELARAEAL